MAQVLITTMAMLYLDSWSTFWKNVLLIMDMAPVWKPWDYAVDMYLRLCRQLHDVIVCKYMARKYSKLRETPELKID